MLLHVKYCMGKWVHLKLSFNDFLSNLTPGVVLAMIGLVLYTEFVYRRDLQVSSAEWRFDPLAGQAG